jgi:hypothetical protein
VRGISLWRPWPWCFTHADKRVENRGHAVDFRGDVVFHAAKRWDEDSIPFIERTARAHGFRPPLMEKTAHVEGALVFVATIVDCVAIEEFERLAGRGAVSMYGSGQVNGRVLESVTPTSTIDWAVQSDWAFGPFCWVLEDVRPLPAPIPWRGKQGWFHVPDVVVDQALTGRSHVPV